MRGCNQLARRFGVSEFLVSIVIIGIGTTIPEILISLISADMGMGTLVVSNAIASNTFRILGILGLGACIHPLTTIGHKRSLDIYFVLMATVAMMWAIVDGVVSASDGIVLGMVFVAYLLAHGVKSFHKPVHIEHEKVRISKIIPPIIGSMVALYFGSEYFMDALLEIASNYSLPERLVAAWIVAPGTSAPEILITIIAAFRKRASIIIGNILGSNIVNICLAVAASAQIAPLLVTPEIIAFDIWVLVGITALFCWQMLHFKRLGRITGILYILLLGLIVFLI